MSVMSMPDQAEAFLRLLPLPDSSKLGEIGARLGLTGREVGRLLDALGDEGLVTVDAGALVLTEAGSELLREPAS